MYVYQDKSKLELTDWLMKQEFVEAREEIFVSSVNLKVGGVIGFSGLVLFAASLYKIMIMQTVPAEFVAHE